MLFDQVLVTSFPPTAAGTCSPAQNLVINNTGGGQLDISSLSLQGRFFFDGVWPPLSQLAGPLSIAGFGTNNTFDVYFCPDIDNDAVYTGRLVIISNDPDSDLVSITLGGSEAP